METVIATFRNWDVRGDGLVARQDFENLLFELGLPRDVASKIVVALEKDGKVDYQVFINWMQGSDPGSEPVSSSSQGEFNKATARGLSVEDDKQVPEASRSGLDSSFAIKVVGVTGEAVATLTSFSSRDPLSKLLEEANAQISGLCHLLHGEVELSQCPAKATLGSLGIDGTSSLTIVMLGFNPSKLELRNNTFSTLEDCEGAEVIYNFSLIYDGKTIWEGGASIQYHGWSNSVRGGHQLSCSLSDDKMTLKTRRHGGTLGTERTHEWSVIDLLDKGFTSSYHD